VKIGSLLEEPVAAARLVIGVHATEERWAPGQNVPQVRTRYRLEQISVAAG
jgi:hypothetical protein